MSILCLWSLAACYGGQSLSQSVKGDYLQWQDSFILGIASTMGMILGIIFTISDTPFYSFYANPEDELEGALKLIREKWQSDAIG